jgi:ATP-dependent exoDNAse (exonuclease V) beta subunit
MSDRENTLIRASAGTGKTFQLSNRYIELLHADVPIDEILATTFTRKAAGEILDRIISRLAEAATNEEAAREFAGQIGEDGLDVDRCRELLVRLTRHLHRLRIGTLDSFFSTVAGTFGLELGLPPGWRIVEGVEDAALRDTAIEAILRDEPGRHIARIVHLLSKGNAERSISELIRNTVSDLYNLYLATTGEAWTQFPKLKPLSAENLAVTVEALAAADLGDKKTLTKARQSDLELLATGDLEALLEKGLTPKIIDGSNKYSRVAIPEPVVELYRKLAAHIRAVLIQQLASQTEASYELLERYAKVYQRIKFEARAMCFADVTRQLADAASKVNVEHMGYRLDAHVTHLLLDEFQDTSLDQWIALRPFALRAATGTSQTTFLPPEGSVFCVGDVKQAIFGWRGGVAEIFDTIESELGGLRLQKLHVSRRSSPVIIESVNKIFQNLTASSTINEMSGAPRAWQDRFEPHTTVKADLPGYVELATAPAADGDEESAEEVTLQHTAKRIAEIAADAPRAEIGVLARRNRIVGRLIFELRELGITASEEGGNPVTDSAAVQAILSLLHLADHPGDTIALAHVTRSPLGAVVGLTSADGPEAATAVAANVRRAVMTEGFGPTVNAWIQQLAPSCSPREFDRLMQLVEIAYRFDADTPVRTSEFVRFVREEKVSDPTASNIRVMTVHQAKGLEFDIVVLTDMDSDLIGQRRNVVVGRPGITEPPNRVSVYRKAAIQSILPADLQQLFRETTDRKVSESLCVLYVAVTRAIHALHMIIAPVAKKGRQQTYARILRGALAESNDAPPETILFQHGDPNWHRHSHAAPSHAVTLPPESIDVQLPEMPSRRIGLDWTSPTELTRGNVRNAADVLQIDSNAALTRGTIVHRWFEMIQWLDDGHPDPSALQEAIQGIDAAGLNIDDLIAQFNAALDQPEIVNLLSRDSYSAGATAYAEYPFAVLGEGKILNGSIDRLVLQFEGDRPVSAEVIDFKTDDIRRDDNHRLAERIEHYRPQLDAYRTAVAKNFGLTTDQISARLLFVSAGVVHEVL